MVASNFIKYAKLLLTERHDSAAAIRYLEQNQSDLDKYGICYLASLYTKTRQSRRAVTLLKPLLGEGRLLARDAIAHATYAKALDNAGESAAAAAHLKPLLAEGRLLASNAIAHATYAKALDNAGERAAAAAHLKPLLGEGRLLALDAIAHATYAKALGNAGERATAAAHLKSLLGESRLLASNAIAHATYAKALDNAGKSAAAAAHLKPLLGESRLLARDAIAHATYAKALDNAGESAAAAAHLKPLLAEGRLLARDPVAITTIAIALLNAERPDEVLSAVAPMPEIDRRNDALLTYVEAKAHFALGHVGQTIMLMTPVVRSFPDDAFAALYLACLDPADQRIPALQTALGPRFSRLWSKSRTLQTSLSALAIQERSLFRENRLWQLGARPVNTAALRELGVFPRVHQASRYHR